MQKLSREILERSEGMTLVKPKHLFKAIHEFTTSAVDNDNPATTPGVI